MSVDNPALLWSTDPPGATDVIRRKWTDICGTEVPQSVSDLWLSELHPHDVDRVCEMHRICVARREPYTLKFRIRSGENSYKWVQDTATPHFADDGQFTGFSGICIDVTDSMQWETSLRERDRMLVTVTQSTRDLLGTRNVDDVIPRALEALGMVTGADRVYIFENTVHPETGSILMNQRFEWVHAGISTQLNNPGLQNLPYENGFTRIFRTLSSGASIKGHTRDLQEEERAICEQQGVLSLMLVPVVVKEKFWGFLGLDACKRERTWSSSEEAIIFAMAGSIGAAIERQHTEHLLAKRDHLLHGVARATTRLFTSREFSEGIVRALEALGESAMVDRAYIFENQTSDSGEKLLSCRYIWGKPGTYSEQTIGSGCCQNLSYEKLFPRWYEILASGRSISGFVRDFLGGEPSIDRENGLRSMLLVPIHMEKQFWGFLGFDDSNLNRTWLPSDESILNTVAGTLGGAIARKRAEDALRKNEEMLQHSQKMEAVGRLAGGVAHDFNNLLTAILGYGELVLDRVDDQHPMYKEMQEICKAAERAHSLTRQLLAFSRKQVLEPKVINVNLVITEMEKLLHRLIGEDVDLQAELFPELGNVKADPGQLEQTIINLCVNARDAMPSGGKLTIRTSNVDLRSTLQKGTVTIPPGSYIMIAVADNGVGMTHEVMAHIFEPFFTTKDVGKGTGLGLAMVYGFVQQSGGAITVESEPARGTTFMIFLPRLSDDVLSRFSPVRKQVDGGDETIFLVEDESVVRELTLRVLRDRGYKVIAARNGDEALSIWDSLTEPVDLLLTDIVMPRMSGRALAQQIEARHPGMKVLYMSGYAQDTLSDMNFDDPDFHFMEKPFTPSTLCRFVRQVLDGK